MPSNRLAFLSVAVGSALLGWATAGVSAIGSDLPEKAVPAKIQHVDRPHHGHDHRERPGI